MKSVFLKPLYDRVIQGIPVLGTPEDVARRFSKGDAAAVDRLVTLYTGLSGATGFVCGLPGILLSAITLPANVTGVAMLQLHMCAAMAVLAGEDVKDKRTRDRCIACLLERRDRKGRNSGEEEVEKRAAVKLAERSLRFAAERTIGWAGKRARRAIFRRVVARRVPILGGILSAGSDAYMTSFVGKLARQEFLAAPRRVGGEERSAAPEGGTLRRGEAIR